MSRIRVTLAATALSFGALLAAAPSAVADPPGYYPGDYFPDLFSCIEEGQRAFYAGEIQAFQCFGWSWQGQDYVRMYVIPNSPPGGGGGGGGGIGDPELPS